MPINAERTVQHSYVLASVTADMEAPRITAQLRHFIDGVDNGTVEDLVEGDGFNAMLGGTPPASTTRADDIANLVYQYCVDSGMIEGTIS